MKNEPHKIADTVDVRLEGEMILADTARMIDYMARICATMDKTVRLDLGGIGRIDTCGVAMLLACHKRIHSAGGTLVWGTVTDEIRSMFSVCKVSDLLRTHGENPAKDGRKS